MSRMLKMFNEIWNEKEHISELTGLPLLPKGHFKWHWQFAHILGKQRYTYYKYNKENIMLMLPEEHEKQEKFDKFIEKKEELKREYYIKYK